MFTLRNAITRLKYLQDANNVEAFEPIQDWSLESIMAAARTVIPRANIIVIDSEAYDSFKEGWSSLGGTIEHEVRPEMVATGLIATVMDCAVFTTVVLEDAEREELEALFTGAYVLYME